MTVGRRLGPGDFIHADAGTHHEALWDRRRRARPARRSDQRAGRSVIGRGADEEVPKSLCANDNPSLTIAALASPDRRDRTPYP